MRPNPEAEIDCVDASAAMIQCARVRTALILRKARDRASVHKPFARAVGLCPPWHESSSQFDKLSRVKFHHADFLQWVPQQQPYDLVVTHFFLDCLDRDRLSHVITKLAYGSAPKSRWLLTDFVIPPNGLHRAHPKI